MTHPGEYEPAAGGLWRHELIRHESPVDVAAVYESPPIAAAAEFNEAVVSWNIDTPAGAGFWVELRVGRRRDDYWTPYLYLGDWGAAPPGPHLTGCDAGQIDVDYFRSHERFDRVQYRIHAAAADGGAAGVRVRRVVLCLSDRPEPPAKLQQNRAAGAIPAQNLPISHTPAHPLYISVPFRSQRTEDPALSERICSPTSLATVLQYRGVDLPTVAVAAACHDPAHNIYGNWPRNIQAAYSLGVPGYLARFSGWDQVESLIAAGQPPIISVRFATPGALTGAPYVTTKGHLLVVCGFDAAGDVRVNDPAAADEQQGRTTYLRRELDQVWLAATGGLAYVLLPRE